ncbi:putative amino acid permease 7 [Quercus suber]|uniref:Amino acid permease 7 n=1 Tax=Quercus suber TaxID=58331 RepID=A0AAW0JJJ6_QUESU
MGGEEEDQESPLLGSSSQPDEPEEPLKRTGVIGAGVLSLAWSVAQLGWIAGEKSQKVSGVIVLESLWGGAVAYVITAATSMSFMEWLSHKLLVGSHRLVRGHSIDGGTR